MAQVRIETDLPAAADVCFDLARSQASHVASASRTGEEIVQGPPHDLLEMGDEVTFSARHFGIRWQMTATIVEFERPRRFVDEMVEGPFRWFRHEHTFTPSAGGTRMVDVFAFALPFDVGGIATRIVGRHLKRFLRMRGEELAKQAVRASLHRNDRVLG